MSTVPTDVALLNLGDGVQLPASVVTHTIGVVGQKRTGKTSSAVVLVEEASAAGAVFAVIDPTGAWLGLRTSADGNGSGLDCIVMGKGGDVPLSPDAGRVVARLVVDDGYSVVCNLWRVPREEQIRFVADFSEELLELGRKRAITVVYDEAPRFVPQGGAKLAEDGPRCRLAVTEVVTQGGAQGIGSILIAQRMSAIHKDVLEQTETLIVHRLKGNNDRGAIKGWLEEAGTEAGSLIEAVPTLRQGQAIVLASEYEIATRLNVRPKSTFDTSATPDVGAVLLDKPQTRPPIDLAELEARMGVALEAAQEHDPETLKRRILALERELAERPADASIEAQENAEARLRAALAEERAIALAAIDDAYALGWENGVTESLANAEARLRAALAEAREVALARRAEAPENLRKTSVQLARRPDDAPRQEHDNPGRPAPAADEPSGDAPAKIKAGAVRMLQVLRAYRQVRPEGLTRFELGCLAVVAQGGTMSNYLSALRAEGLIEEDGKGVKLSERGMTRTKPAKPYTRDEVVALHAPKLKAGARKMLDVLMRMHPAGCTRKELSGLAGVAQGGTLSNYLSSLRKRGLIEERNRRVYAGALLYLGEGR